MKAYAQEVLQAALAGGGDFAEIFFEDTRSTRMQLVSSEAESINFSRLHGAGIRVFVGLNPVYAFTNETDREGLLRCAAQVVKAVRDQKQTVFQLPPLVTPQLPPPDRILLMPSTVENKRKLDILRAADSAARAVSADIRQVNCMFLDVEQDVTIANTEGLYVEDTRVRTRMSCMAIADNGKEKQTAHMGPGASMGFELFEQRVNPAETGRQAAQSAVLMLNAKDCPAGVMPVVIDGGFGGVIFHEACGHSLEATAVAFNISVFSGKLGQKIAADCVTAVDDGTIPNEWGSTRVDDEGMQTTNLTLIENGILKNYMIDKLNGKRMGMAPTGSGRRQNYTFNPTSRMRNTFIAPGKDDTDEMIRTMGDGLYAKRMGGGSVNPGTGEFNFAVAEGYLVKDGKITTPVRGASLIGKGADILMKIDRVGKEMTMDQGMCGSSSGSVPTNVGQPMIRVSEMTVGGRAKE
ncbi:MAG TPA: TldD/PmbA family protein [Candidatus Limiplasma sp.]|nr:TldD/PmbA family protein [Candidatus Limiplasma sp.]